jgi:hypothetical protein
MFCEPSLVFYVQLGMKYSILNVGKVLNGLFVVEGKWKCIPCNVLCARALEAGYDGSDNVL